MDTYPAIGQKTWGGAVARWNGLKRHQRAHAAAVCRAKGHLTVRCPVGLFCLRCCGYFRGKDE